MEGALRRTRRLGRLALPHADAVRRGGAWPASVEEGIQIRSADSSGLLWQEWDGNERTSQVRVEHVTLGCFAVTHYHDTLTGTLTPRSKVTHVNFGRKMLVLRVRCVDDGRELLLERHGVDERSIQVAELKRLITQQRPHLRACSDEESKGEGEDGSQGDAELGESFVLLQGRILADGDMVNLVALASSDFFVFAPDVPSSPLINDTEDVHSNRRSLPEAEPRRKRRRLAANSEEDTETHQLQLQQLEDMGFVQSLAKAALQQSRYNLSDAVALLAGGAVQELDCNSAIAIEDGDEKADEASLTDMGAELLTRYPSIAPLGSFVNDGKVRKLRELAATDSFQALLLLRQQFSSRDLARMNENPVATLRLLSLPAPPPIRTTKQQCQEDPGDRSVDVDSDDWTTTGANTSDSAIDRVRLPELRLYWANHHSVF
ncbi:hypothetical protein BBJ28_00020607 [Nothophytophthora sp. Chile5]|nr:hypothetical protein BBJ28_00020607 [Nothophytophthora sp. Chile5]